MHDPVTDNIHNMLLSANLKDDTKVEEQMKTLHDLPEPLLQQIIKKNWKQELVVYTSLSSQKMFFVRFPSVFK